MNPCPSVLETAILPLNYFPEMIKYMIEIKYRIMSIFIAITTSMLTLIKYRYYMIHFLLEASPELNEGPTKYFILTSITELFDVFFNAWLFVTSHILYYFTHYHIISFMSLGLYKREYNNLKRFFMSSFYIWIASVYLFLKVWLPLTYLFFFEFGQKSDCKHFNLYLEPKLDTYLNFTVNIYIHCYLIFQLILVLVFLINYTKTIYFITRFKKTLYISTLMIATIVTPPEVWSQITVFFFLTLSIEVCSIRNLFNNNLRVMKR